MDAVRTWPADAGRDGSSERRVERRGPHSDIVERIARSVERTHRTYTELTHPSPPRHWWLTAGNYVHLYTTHDVHRYTTHETHSQSSTSCARGRHNMPRPCKFTFDLLTLKVVSRVTCDVGYLCANFSLPRPLCFRLRADVRDRQTTDKSVA